MVARTPPGPRLTSYPVRVTSESGLSVRLSVHLCCSNTTLWKTLGAKGH